MLNPQTKATQVSMGPEGRSLPEECNLAFRILFLLAPAQQTASQIVNLLP